jgi:hypothetical protein
MLAYFDSFHGLVPCKVVSIDPRPFGEIAITLKATAARGPYDRGAIISTNARAAIPRKAIRVRSGQYRVRPYLWTVDGPKVGA